MNINTSILNLGFLSFFLTSFVCLGFPPFSHRISKDSSWLWVSQIFLVSDNLDSLEDAWSVFCRWSLNWDLSDVFLNRPGCGFLGRRPQRLRQWHPTPVTLAWRIPWTEERSGLQSMGSWRVRHDWSTSLSHFPFIYWRRKWQPIPLFLPGESQGRGSWWAAVYGVAKSQTRLKWLSSFTLCPGYISYYKPDLITWLRWCLFQVSPLYCYSAPLFYIVLSSSEAHT